ncbi:hepatic lectin-like isoform X1 [Cloeon dipterum]|uniref:hepatic lectin-like isoform X1 n=1 Tax=Cloeon dipterum TaxID=197152 RepID=UPI0032200965
MKSLSGAFFLFVGATFLFAPFCDAGHAILHELERQQRSTIEYSCDDQAYYDQFASSKQALCDESLENAITELRASKSQCLEKLQKLVEQQQEKLAICSQARSTNAASCSAKLAALSSQIGQCQAKCSAATVALKLVKLSTGSYYISPSSEQKNWHMADKFCKSNGLELASVETIKENDALVAAFGPSTDRFWISGTDLGSEKKFYWSGVGKTMETFWYFEDGQPDNANNNENCVQYVKETNKPTYKWNDENCNTPFRFVCELEATK